eukprot:7379598-Prymnesium_polylepis.2
MSVRTQWGSWRAAWRASYQAGVHLLGHLESVGRRCGWRRCAGHLRRWTVLTAAVTSSEPPSTCNYRYAGWTVPHQDKPNNFP